LFSDPPIEICGFDKKDCSDAVKYNLSVIHFTPCNCLPACTSISFDTEVHLANLNVSASLGGHKFDLDKFEYSQIKVYFKENSFMTSRRMELYGTTDFLATCGGLLGLFLGVSIISLLEIVYFCTIRLYLKLRTGEKLDQERQIEPVEDSQRKHVEKTKRCIEVLKNLMTDYFTKTTIQGINYVTSTGLSLVERTWWAMVLVLSTFCCGALISNVIRLYEKSPIIISYANEETPISKVKIKMGTTTFR
jgi:Amiloride-sensitive sodium channel